jgi:hypothetical protein
MAEAMNLTYGDLILIEIALLEKLKGLDLSMQSGQYFSELIGKIEYQLQQLRGAADSQLGPGLVPGQEKPQV